MMDKRQRRRCEAIHFYSGSNGGGKTLAAVYDTIPSLEAGRRVLSTVRLLDPVERADSFEEHLDAWGDHGIDAVGQAFTDDRCLPHPGYVRWTTYAQLLDWRDGDVLADEVQGIISSRSTNTTPSAIVNAMQQLRRADVLFRATAPSFARLDVAVREVTQALTMCKGLLAIPVEGRLWSSSRLLRWSTYNARDYDEWDNAKAQDKVKHPRSLGQWFWRPGHPEVTAYYDTFAFVDVIESATEGGSCLACGGRRTRPKCSCDDVAAGEHARGSVRAQQPTVEHDTPDEPELDTVTEPLPVPA